MTSLLVKGRWADERALDLFDADLYLAVVRKPGPKLAKLPGRDPPKGSSAGQ